MDHLIFLLLKTDATLRHCVCVMMKFFFLACKLAMEYDEFG